MTQIPDHAPVVVHDITVTRNADDTLVVRGRGWAVTEEGAGPVTVDGTYASTDAALIAVAELIAGLNPP